MPNTTSNNLVNSLQNDLFKNNQFQNNQFQNDQFPSDQINSNKLPFQNNQSQNSPFFVQARKPRCDDKDYVVVQISNLKFILVHDKNAQMAAVSASFGVGSMACKTKSKSGLKYKNGLAHFMEHIFFQGSKSAKINFQALIAECGGLTNAFTADEKTVFMASFKLKFFDKVIKQFTEMFLDPKFNVKMSENEKIAVDNEYKMNRLDDGWRLREVWRELIKNKTQHPYGRDFGCGTSESLRNVDKNMVLDFYEQHYKHQPIIISILSPLEIPQMMDSLKSFNHLFTENKRIDFKNNPFDCLKGKKIDIRALNDEDSISYHFVMDPVYFDPRGGDMEPLIMLIKNPEDLFSKLNNDKTLLASDVECFLSENTSFGALLSIEVELTPYATKYKKFKDVDEIVFGYLENLRKMYLYDNKAHERTTRHLEYTKQVLEKRFDYTDPQDAFDTVQEIVLNTDRNEKDPTNAVMNTFNLDIEDARKWFIKGLECLRPENMFCMFLSKDHINEAPMNEKWFGTKYNSYDFTKPSLHRMDKIISNPITAPIELEHLIPTDKGCEILENVPDYKHEREGVYFFIKHKPQFRKPMVMASVQLVLNKKYYPEGMDWEELIVRSTVCHLVNNYLKRKMGKYHRIMSGYSIDVSKEGFGIGLTCFTEHMELVLVDAIKIMKNFIKMEFEPDMKKYIETWFGQSIERMAKTTGNMKVCQPYRQCAEGFNMLVLKGQKTIDEQIEMIKQIKLESINSIKETWKDPKRNHFGVKILVEGNTHENMKDIIHQHLDEYSQNIVPLENLYCPTVNLWNKSVTSRQMAHLEDEINSAVIFVRSLGCCDLLKETIAEVYNGLMQQNFFDVLRSQKQLGYVVTCRMTSVHGQLYHQSIIQSSSVGPTKIKEEITNYLNDFDKDASKKVEDILERIDNRQKQLIEPIKSLSECFEKDWAELDSYRMNFDADDKKVHILESLKNDPSGYVQVLIDHMHSGKTFSFETYGKDHREEFDQADENQLQLQSEQLGLTKEAKITIEEIDKIKEEIKQDKNKEESESPLMIKEFPSEAIIFNKPGMEIEVC